MKLVLVDSPVNVCPPEMTDEKLVELALPPYSSVAGFIDRNEPLDVC
jgi:hypothetical protein